MADGKRQRFQTLRGMRDFLAPESGRRRLLVERFAASAHLAGYEEVVPPLVEELDVFRRVGDATDVVTKEMYDFTDRDGTQIALRPEMTAGVVRAFVQHHPNLPWKVWYAGTNFRHERPQKGRYRMFDQVGVEVLGIDDPDIDVEVIALADGFFRSIGLGRVRLLINSLGEQADRAQYAENLKRYFESKRDRLSEASSATLERNPLRVLDSKRPEDREVIDAAPQMAEHLSPAARAHFDRVLGGLDALGISYEITPRLVRGLDYYRRSTFEFVSDALDSAQNAVGGGGRYDGLSEAMGGAPTDGIGFALGVDRLLLACDAEGSFPSPDRSLDAYVVDLLDGSHARDLTHELRSAGLSADRRFGGGSLKAQMRSADRSGARFAIIVGEDEVADGAVTVRPMLGIASDGDQRRVARGRLCEEIRRSIGDSAPATKQSSPTAGPDRMPDRAERTPEDESNNLGTPRES